MTDHISSPFATDLIADLTVAYADTIRYWQQIDDLGSNVTIELAQLVDAGALSREAANDVLTSNGFNPLPEDETSDTLRIPVPSSWPRLLDYLTAAMAIRDRARRTAQSTARAVRAALVIAAREGVLKAQEQATTGEPPQQYAYEVVDAILRRLELPGLGRAHQYEVAMTLVATVDADDAGEARRMVWESLRCALPHATHGSQPSVSFAEHIVQPEFSRVGDQRWQVRWHETLIVSCPVAHSPSIAEAAVRRRLRTIVELIPAADQAPLTVHSLGERIDPRLDTDQQ